MERSHYVYLLTNWSNKIIYTGVTDNLQKRVYEHKNILVDGFTKEYHVCKLVYFEVLDDEVTATAREQEIKTWSREKKDRLINRSNPAWRDLSKDWSSVYEDIMPYEIEE